MMQLHMLLIQKSARNQMVKEGKQSDYNLQHRSNKKDRQDVVNGKELTDLHINAYQQLIKNRLPNIHGLQDTVLQEVRPLKHSKSLQIIHVRNSHWAVFER